MLCNVTEGGKPKCAQYYPMNLGEAKVYGTITVTNKKNLTAQNEKVSCLSNLFLALLGIRIDSF